MYGTCKAAQPKVQKFISENEDPDNMGTEYLDFCYKLNLLQDLYKKQRPHNPASSFIMRLTHFFSCGSRKHNRQAVGVE